MRRAIVRRFGIAGKRELQQDPPRRGASAAA
jgi:hypothetical protein